MYLYKCQNDIGYRKTVVLVETVEEGRNNTSMFAVAFLSWLPLHSFHVLHVYRIVAHSHNTVHSKSPVANCVLQRSVVLCPNCLVLYEQAHSSTATRLFDVSLLLRFVHMVHSSSPLKKPDVLHRSVVQDVLLNKLSLSLYIYHMM